ncbi:uncharacterized protein FTJAE_13749 [Fusarium tjaetaba]|uniref:Uncharacterized protein n=1 Tax=Fusarium tjaetaba TaxID=1567544 RepID=A0A8H5VA48_9HYPO|nr:uncharacterized protein FTJAE_13749 [Fusarium tjaetaba]KAF5614480.1 hypothetical protein FTJAE_13749 [Fusarium tjaetaba]
MSEPTSISGPTHIHTVWRKREKELSTAQRLIGMVTPSPEKQLQEFIIKHEIHWNSRWDKDKKLRLTVPLGGKSPEETLANLGYQMQREGLNKYWEYVTQALTDDPNKVDPRVYKNDQGLQKEALTNKS